MCQIVKRNKQFKSEKLRKKLNKQLELIKLYKKKNNNSKIKT